jgi:thiosulfate/3-mercaptopyruvate sulfurtransferase
LSDTFTRTGIHADSIVVVYSPSADGVNVATRAWCVLRRAGLADVRVLDGGLDAWVAAGGERGEALTEAEGLGSAEP